MSRNSQMRANYKEKFPLFSIVLGNLYLLVFLELTDHFSWGFLLKCGIEMSNTNIKCYLGNFRLILPDYITYVIISNFQPTPTWIKSYPLYCLLKLNSAFCLNLYQKYQNKALKMFGEKCAENRICKYHFTRVHLMYISFFLFFFFWIW